MINKKFVRIIHVHIQSKNNTEYIDNLMFNAELINGSTSLIVILHPHPL